MEYSKVTFTHAKIARLQMWFRHWTSWYKLRKKQRRYKCQTAFQTFDTNSFSNVELECERCKTTSKTAKTRKSVSAFEYFWWWSKAVFLAFSVLYLYVYLFLFRFKFHEYFKIKINFFGISFSISFSDMFKYKRSFFYFFKLHTKLKFFVRFAISLS